MLTPAQTPDPGARHLSLRGSSSVLCRKKIDYIALALLIHLYYSAHEASGPRNTESIEVGSSSTPATAPRLEVDAREQEAFIALEEHTRGKGGTAGQSP